MLTVLRKSERKDEDGRNIWVCRCDCGNEKEIPDQILRSGKVISCGCRELPVESIEPKSSIEEQIAELEETAKMLEAQKKRLLSEKEREERRKRKKHYIEIGRTVCSVVGDDGQDGDLDKFLAFLTEHEDELLSAMGRTEKKKIDFFSIQKEDIP